MRILSIVILLALTGCASAPVGSPCAGSFMCMD